MSRLYLRFMYCMMALSIASLAKRTERGLGIRAAAREVGISHATLARVEKDTDRDNFMSAREAKEYGLVDHVLERVPASQMPSRPTQSQ